jgi:hypothetical protein
MRSRRGHCGAPDLRQLGAGDLAGRIRRHDRSGRPAYPGRDEVRIAGTTDDGQESPNVRGMPVRLPRRGGLDPPAECPGTGRVNDHIAGALADEAAASWQPMSHRLPACGPNERQPVDPDPDQFAEFVLRRIRRVPTIAPRRSMATARCLLRYRLAAAHRRQVGRDPVGDRLDPQGGEPHRGSGNRVGWPSGRIESGGPPPGSDPARPRRRPGRLPRRPRGSRRLDG